MTTSQLEIRGVDVYDEDAFRDYYAIMREAGTHERPFAPMWAHHEAAVMFRHQEQTEVWNAFAAYDDDTMVGIGFVVTFTMDNTDKAFIEVSVPLARRRQGIGGVLIDHSLALGREARRSILVAETAYPLNQRDDHHHRRFLESHGFTLASTEIGRTLQLPVSDQQLTAWKAEAAPRHAQYRLESFEGALPDELLPSFCHVVSLLPAEAPTGELEFEPEMVTPEIWREREAKIAEQRRTVFTTVAIPTEGKVVAATQLVVPELDPPKVYQWATLVLREHRGHRLGLAVKARNLEAVQKAHPDRTSVWTCNEESNGPMVDINVRMGFRPVEILANYQRRISERSHHEPTS